MKNSTKALKLYYSAGFYEIERYNDNFQAEVFMELKLNDPKKEIVESIAYCGLVCKLCHLASKCDGCRNTANKCPNHSGKWEGCYHRNCCIKKNINGCWEWADFPCKKDMFSDTHDLRIRAFVRFIKEEGLEKLADCLIENEKKGIKYGYQKDYDFEKSEDEVLELLRTGEKPGN